MHHHMMSPSTWTLLGLIIDHLLHIYLLTLFLHLMALKGCIIIVTNISCREVVS